jgi:hypothetical protein
MAHVLTYMIGRLVNPNRNVRDLLSIKESPAAQQTHSTPSTANVDRTSKQTIAANEGKQTSTHIPT